MRGFHIALTSVVLLACTQLPLVTPPQQSDYERTLYRARKNVDAGNYWAAERLLEEFVRTHPEAREAKEIAFWKAAYMVDPANDRGSLADGIAALDGYVADSAAWYRNEAIVLRRTAAVAHGVSANRAAASEATPATAGTTDTVVVVKRTRDEEIVALKEQLAKSREELAKVSAELERIKKRLANPSN
jgi:hypothetical protein